MPEKMVKINLRSGTRPDPTDGRGECAPTAAQDFSFFIFNFHLPSPPASPLGWEGRVRTDILGVFDAQGNLYGT